MKVKSVIDTGRKTNKTGAPVIEVTIDDGRKCTCFSEKAKELKEGDELPAGSEIKENGEYNGEKKYLLNLPKDGGGAKKPGFQKDWGLEKKKIALETVSKIDSGIDIKIFLAKADEILNWINK